MYRRKIQLIAGSTYTVSLPKEWIIKNHLKEKNEVNITEKNNRLILSKGDEQKTEKNLDIDVDKYSNIKDVLFTLYYQGIEVINLYSKKEISKNIKSDIRKTLMHISGAEITYEDKKKIIIQILLDRSKIKLKQIIYRSLLIIDMSLSNILNGNNFDEVFLNEEEIDRLYNLMTSIITLSIIDAEILDSSGIEEVFLIPQYFLIIKRIENLADEIYRIGEYINTGIKLEDPCKKIIKFIRDELNRTHNFFLKKNIIFKKIEKEDIKSLRPDDIKNKAVHIHIDSIIRYMKDIEESMVKISLYEELF
jgi:phosphate uptake regulator